MENNMDSEQFAAIMSALKDNNNKLGELSGDFREFKGIHTTKVDQLVKDADSDRLWSRIQTIAVIPIVVALHETARALGFTKT